jgi:DNA polymerase III subunit gamma/tau
MEKAMSVDAIKTVNLGAEMRPKKLSGYIGQEHITVPLAAMLKSGTLPSTILASGPTGCGKTTLAYLLGRYLNCDTNDSCGKCPSCKSMTSGTNPDYYTIDAGTKGRIEDTRNLIETLNLMPLRKKRIIVVDEAHAMTKQSGNALLVAIENPPPDTVFILCTTEPQKMLPTIVGRCLQLRVQTVEPEIIQERLRYIVDLKAKRAGVKFKKSQSADIDMVLQAIAEGSGGFVRNAISCLQAVIALMISGEKFDVEETIKSVALFSEADVNVAATELVISVLSMDLLGTIKAIRSTDNAMLLCERARWITHGLLGSIASCNKYTTNEVRNVLTALKKGKVKYTAVPIVYLQAALNDVSVQITTVAINGTVLLETAVAKMMTDIYAGKLKTDLGEK